jgi:hypothetical protein
MPTVVMCVHVFPGEEGCQMIWGELRSNKTFSSAGRYVAYLETRLPGVEGYLEARASAGTKRAASIVPQPLARS